MPMYDIYMIFWARVADSINASESNVNTNLKDVPGFSKNKKGLITLNAPPSKGGK